MNDLLGIQIRESCKLALPNGLKELMEDISREVLRAQPDNLYSFIIEYLAAMLEARDNLSVAVRVCEEVCDSTCHPELTFDLRALGLNDQVVAEIDNIVKEYLKNGHVNEKNLLIVLSKKLDLDSEMLPAVQEAVRSAYHRHFIENAPHNVFQYENFFVTDAGDSSSTRAAKNTVKFHQTTIEDDPEDDFNEDTTKHKCSVTSISSMSLAGSFLDLPKYVPYSATDCTVLSSLTEHPETEQSNLDYSCTPRGAPKEVACKAKKKGGTECDGCASKPCLK